MNKILYKDVKRRAFDEVCDLLSNNEKLGFACCVNYNGSNFCGDLIIDMSPGYTKEHKILVEEVAKIVKEYGF